MRKSIILASAAAACLAPLVAPTAAIAMPRTITVETVPQLQNPDNCVGDCTIIAMGIDYGSEDEYGALFFAKTGQRVANSDGRKTNTQTRFGQPSNLAPGRYIFRANFYKPAQWWCSIYNEDGCTWLETDDRYGYWTFTWTGQRMSSTRNPVKFATCKKLRAFYPNGVASTSKKAKGTKKPIVGNSIITANSKNKKLKRSKSGVLCPR